jgi:hypothetical protein
VLGGGPRAANSLAVLCEQVRPVENGFLKQRNDFGSQTIYKCKKTRQQDAEILFTRFDQPIKSWDKMFLKLF